MNQADKKYIEIDFGWGSTIKEAVERLTRNPSPKRLYKGEFNGVMLYSDTVTLDSAYKQITGKTKDEFDAEREAKNNAYEKEKEEHKKNIPSLTEKYNELGREILDEEYWEAWERCVPIRLDDLYRGMELQCCLDIVKILNDSRNFKKAEKVLNEQGHSGMSYGLVLGMVGELCKQGYDFHYYVKGEK